MQVTNEEIGRLSSWLATIAEMRGRPPPSPAVQTVFIRLLSEYPYDVVDQAILAHLASPAGAYTSPLQPAQIIEHINRRWQPSTHAPSQSAGHELPPVPKPEGRAYLEIIKTRLSTPLQADPDDATKQEKTYEDTERRPGSNCQTRSAQTEEHHRSAQASFANH